MIKDYNSSCSDASSDDDVSQAKILDGTSDSSDDD